VGSLLRSPAGAPVAGAGYSLTASQAARVRAYLARLLQAGALGGLALSAGAGGPLPARNISDWLYGARSLLHLIPPEHALLKSGPESLFQRGRCRAGWVDPLLGGSAFGRVGAAPAGRVALGMGWPTFDAPMQAPPCHGAAPSAATEGRWLRVDTGVRLWSFKDIVALQIVELFGAGGMHASCVHATLDLLTAPTAC